MAEIPKDFSYELAEDARKLMLSTIALHAPIHEDEAIDRVSRELNTYESVALYALSSLDGVIDNRGILTLAD